jgi:chorismate--pyruvate lyase
MLDRTGAGLLQRHCPNRFMMRPSAASAKWVAHVNGVNPPHEMRNWLTDRVSLTIKLIEHSKSFRVRRLVQQRALCLSDEFSMAELPRRMCVQERDVLLCCDAIPVVFAHTIVPLQASASDWPFFSSLGERSLGATLFGDPLVWRGVLQFARLPVRHPLAMRAHAAIGGAENANPLYARRCLFRRKNGILLVTEVFLPTITDLTLMQTGSTG